MTIAKVDKRTHRKMWRRRLFRWLGWSAIAALCGLAAVLAALYVLLAGSLPKLDGRSICPGLGATVIIRRDALGTPDIHAQDRFDLARAIGFVHGQDRFFQMDQLRRVGAGELAELFGPAVLEMDRANRWHGFRAIAVKVVQSLSADEARLLRAYVDGVNAGLAALRTRPPEYLGIATAAAAVAGGGYVPGDLCHAIPTCESLRG